MRLDGLRFGIAGGATWGVGVALATLFAYTTGHGVEALSMFTFYPGYDVSLIGIGIGFLWGAIDGFFGCIVFAWIYNHVHRKHEKTS